MTETPTPEEALLEELQEALAEADAVPADVLNVAKASYTWRTMDTELAELVFDSAVDEMAGIRGDAAAARQLSFQSKDLEIEIMVHDGEITGQLVPVHEATVELFAGGSTRQADVDEFGSFVFRDVPRGHVRLSCEIGEASITTEWILL